MTGPQLKINGEWIALPEDFSLSLEQSNPLFNDQGTFSFPFEVPLEPNRHVFKNLADPFGHISLKAVNGLDAELWFGGIMLYKGKTETEQEVEISDSVPITFVSGNSDFKNRIDGMNARDVPLDRDIKLGYVVEKATGTATDGRGSKYSVTKELPPYMMMNFTEYNVSDPYPIRPYCNVRVCTQGVNSEGEADGYQILPAKRPFSGVCFYVMYLMDCLFRHLGIVFEKTEIEAVEDLNRLAFFTTKCKVEYKGDFRKIQLSEIKENDFIGSDFTFNVHSNNYGRAREWDLSTEQFTYQGRDVFATNENYPDVSIEDIISDLETAFGIRMIFDGESNRMRMLLLKNVFRDNSMIEHSTTITSLKLSCYRPKNIRLTYGKENDTAFNYNEYSNVKLFNGYGDILSDGITNYDTTCKIDKKTGNAYRIKVNEKTGLGATLMEVGGYRDYVEENGGDEEENLSIKFSPVISNDVTGGGPTQGRYQKRVEQVTNNTTRVDSSEYETEAQEFAVFANVELTVGEMYDKKKTYFYYSSRPGGLLKGFELGYDYLKGKCYELFDTETSEESPTQSYDAGYTLGIMRGPGNDAGLEFEDNYDEEGNDSFSIVASGYAFSSDTCDNYGRFFDYNGTLPGGVKMPGSFSLKLVAGKPGFPIDGEYADRGLVSQFLSEYLYFLAHRKLVTLSVKMSISEIIHIDFLKRHRIGEFVGFINKVSYSLDESGVNDVEVEMYIL